jgi:hypothetical protein
VERKRATKESSHSAQLDAWCWRTSPLAPRLKTTIAILTNMTKYWGHITMTGISCLSQDDERWSNNWSPVTASKHIWFFQTLPTSCDWYIFHCLHSGTGEHFQFPLHLQICSQIAVLDLEYWSNVALRKPHNNRIAHYLERVRVDLLKELQAGQSCQLAALDIWQPDCLRPWAIRIYHGFGHSQFGRHSYLETCQNNGWEPCLHDQPTKYCE